MHLRVDAQKLNFRSEPKTGPDTLIAALDLAEPVETLDEPSAAGWVRARATIDGAPREGYLAARYLRPETTPPVEALIAAAVGQWRRFRYGLGKEHEAPFHAFVAEMWAAIGLDLDGRDRDVPWSAAAISYMVRAAGPAYAGFRFAAAHARYINDAIVRRASNDPAAPFWGYRLWERRPALGDMVCQWRETPRGFDDAAASAFFKSHADIVVRVGRERVWAIGGNVGDSVALKSYALTADGHLAERNHVFALLGNRAA